MSDSFGSVSINTLQDQLHRGGGSKVEVIEIAGGDTRYVDLAGAAAETLTARIFFDNYSDYTSLRALRSTQQTLVTVFGTESAVLLSLEFVPNTWQPGDVFDAGAVFLIV